MWARSHLRNVQQKVKVGEARPGPPDSADRDVVEPTLAKWLSTTRGRQVPGHDGSDFGILLKYCKMKHREWSECETYTYDLIKSNHATLIWMFLWGTFWRPWCKWCWWWWNHGEARMTRARAHRGSSLSCCCPVESVFRCPSSSLPVSEDA